MFKILHNIDSRKATQQGHIPVRIIKWNKFTFSKFLTETFNNSTFPLGLMKADIKPVYKKDDPFGKTKVQF